MEKTKKKRIKRYLVWVLLAAMVAGLAAMPLLAAREQEASGPQATILSASAEPADLEITIRGGGILADGESEDVTLPQGVQITEFLVENHQTVTAGTPVARVDRVSVMNTILQVKASMDIIQEQLAAAMDDTIEPTIHSAAGGRVKAVFASPGDNVQEVMLRHGALAVLSLDGLMGVALEGNEKLGAGDPVSVILGSGEAVSGRVESSLNGSTVVTVTDKGYAIGEPVRVVAEDGRELGSGNLYVHNAWKATGYSGTVQSVYIRVDQTVGAGASLFYLTDRSFTGTRDTLTAQYREYADVLQELLQMYETEVVTVPRDGIVSGVDGDSPFLLSAESEGWTAQPLGASRNSGWQVILLSGGSQELCTGKETEEGVCQAKDHITGCYYHCTGTASCTAKPTDHRVTCLSLCISATEEGKCLALNHKSGCIEKCESQTEAGKCPATVHKVSCVESCVPTDGTTDCPATAHKPECLEACDKKETCPATDHHYPECLTLCTGASDCPALCHKDGCYMTELTYYAYAVLVRQVGSAELVVAADTNTLYQIKTGSSGWELVSPAAIARELLLSEQTLSVSNPSQYKSGDILLLWTAYQGEEAVKNGVAIHSRGNSGSGGYPGGFPGGILSGFGSFGGFGSYGSMPQDTGETLYDLTGQVLLTVTDHSSMTLTVTLDERDISKVQPGQTAAVKITALKGETFQAIVTKVGTEGTNNGGSSKFTAELTLPRQKDMLAGMHATASIVHAVRQQVLTIPVAALTEEPGATMVYTTLDPKTGEPAGRREVATGVSDGQNVEILSGLQPGDMVYYPYYETPELDHSVESGFGR